MSIETQVFSIENAHKSLKINGILRGSLLEIILCNHSLLMSSRFYLDDIFLSQIRKIGFCFSEKVNADK